MIDWKRCSAEMPDDNDECILYSDETDKVLGPIVYKADMGAWMDLFATPEAGYIFKPGENGPTHWAIWNEPAAV
jgi:hypothetical protein